MRDVAEHAVGGPRVGRAGEIAECFGCVGGREEALGVGGAERVEGDGAEAEVGVVLGHV